MTDLIPVLHFICAMYMQQILLYFFHLMYIIRFSVVTTG